MSKRRPSRAEKGIIGEPANSASHILCSGSVDSISMRMVGYISTDDGLRIRGPHCRPELSRLLPRG